MSQPWNEKDVFLEALARSGEAREQFLRDACPDEAARERVRALIRAHSEVSTRVLDATPPRLEADAPMPEAIDEFRLLRELGRGGMGVVYLAQDLQLERPVALKVLAAHLVNSERAKGRFRHEAKAVAALRHPAIVPVYRYAQGEGVQYIAMQYVEGSTLAEELDRLRAAAANARPAPAAGASPPTATTRDHVRRMAALLIPVADALEHAHRAGVVHRDVKPSNILLSARDEAFLTDFGIAKLMSDNSLTGTLDAVGTPHYMSPEQAATRAVRVDHRADVFSLGVVLYESLTLLRPFDGGTSQAVLAAIRTAEPPRPRAVNAGISRDLETICLKALEKNPADRYQTAAHFAADLRCFLAGEPILARPRPLLDRIARAVRRRPRTATGVVVGALVLAAVASAAQAWRLHARRFATVVVTSPAPDARAVVLDQSTGRQVASAPAPARFRLPRGSYTVGVTTTRINGFGEYALAITDTPGAINVNVPVRDTDEVTAGMVLIDAAVHRIGRPGFVEPDPERERTVALPAFWIDASEVTNAEYRAFLDQVPHEPAAVPRYWQDGYDPSWDPLPVVMVRQADAAAYALWRGKRLPTAEEWEAAARAPDGRLHPWGDGTPPAPPRPGSYEEYDTSDGPTGFRVYLRSTVPAAQVGPDRTPAGLLHMFGNVMERTATIDPFRGVIIKGGTWYRSPARWDVSRTMSAPVTTRSSDIGFRCAKSAAPPGP